ncbi:MAG: GAF domain-containing protein [Elusimicrobiaceae bacterium]|nr:GAF domain-containing protein [Elusimicrobiaceae bacterium]
MTKIELYAQLLPQITSLLQGETDPVANMANLAAVLYHNLQQINWAGFYVRREDELVLGPFQGKPACVRLKRRHGVCWAAVEKRETLIVPDVHTFAGHIACDSASQSEIVVPILKGTEVWGVLDIDSPVKARFDETDQAFLEQTVNIFVTATFARSKQI